MTRQPGAGSRSNLPVNVLLVALLALALVASSYAGSKAGARASTPATTSVGQPSAAARPVTSLWFGDSIVEGCCRSTSSVRSMAQEAASQLGWAEPQIAAGGGTGYLTARTLGDVRSASYPERIEAAVQSAYYDVVIVAGGNNDATASFDPVRFRSAVREVLAQVRANLPEAQMVVLGPYSPDGTGYDMQRTIEREEAARVGAAFIDGVALGWMRGRLDLLDGDGFHPNDAGHAHLGARVADALGELPDLT